MAVGWLSGKQLGSTTFSGVDECMCAERFVAERQPLASPFAGEEHQCRDPAGEMLSMQHAEPASKRSKHVRALSQLLPDILP